MNRRIHNKISGGLAIFYGVSFVIIPLTLAGVLVYWLYQVYTGQADFAWGKLAALLLIGIVPGLLGYVLIRVGHEQIEE